MGDYFKSMKSTTRITWHSEPFIRYISYLSDFILFNKSNHFPIQIFWDEYPISVDQGQKFGRIATYYVLNVYFYVPPTIFAIENTSNICKYIDHWIRDLQIKFPRLIKVYLKFLDTFQGYVETDSSKEVHSPFKNWYSILISFDLKKSFKCKYSKQLVC